MNQAAELLLETKIYPLAGIELPEKVAIADHINLSGASPRDIGFIPITELYVDKNSADAIIVACLKEGVTPSAEEEQALKEAGVSAYTYDLLDKALKAAASSKKVKAIGLL